MAYKNMLVAPADGINPKNAYESEVALAAVSDSAWMLIPKDISDVSYVLSVAGGGKGKVQVTTDSVNTVKTGSPVAIDWPAGEVSVNTSDSSVPVTAVRLSQTFAGTTKLTIRAQ